jgi:hypothetical protein
MATTEQQRHRMIERAVLRRPDTQADISIGMWESLATELRTIIGERGFELLYARSLERAGAQFPWLAPHPPQAAGDAFALLTASLNARAPAEAHAASAAFLNVFTDTLILLIGELLTNSLLRKAWGDDVVNNAGTEHRS